MATASPGASRPWTATAARTTSVASALSREATAPSSATSKASTARPRPAGDGPQRRPVPTPQRRAGGAASALKMATASSSAVSALTWGREGLDAFHLAEASGGLGAETPSNSIRPGWTTRARGPALVLSCCPLQVSKDGRGPHSGPGSTRWPGGRGRHQRRMVRRGPRPAAARRGMTRLSLCSAMNRHRASARARSASRHPGWSRTRRGCSSTASAPRTFAGTSDWRSRRSVTSCAGWCSMAH